ncbi:hypothetical protein D9M69_622970 [compost metagenome]
MQERLQCPDIQPTDIQRKIQRFLLLREVSTFEFKVIIQSAQRSVNRYLLQVITLRFSPQIAQGYLVEVEIINVCLSRKSQVAVTHIIHQLQVKIQVAGGQGRIL